MAQPPGPGMIGGSDETPPTVDAPPCRTSVRTLALTTVPFIGVAFVFVLQLFATSAAPPTDGSQSSGPPIQALVFLGFSVVAVLASGASWWARTYTIGSDEIVIDEGVLSRRRRVIPYGRIQQIDVDQPFLAQLLSVGTLTIETAGSAGGTAKLGMLDIKLARGTRHYALDRRAQIQASKAAAEAAEAASARGEAAVAPGWGPGLPPPPAGFAPPPSERVLLRLGFGRLAVAGFTHHFVVIFTPSVLLAGLIFGAVKVASDPSVSAIAALLGGVAVGAAIAFAFVWLVFMQYVVGEWGYTLAEQGDDLHLRFGLLQVRNMTIPRRRVQHITVSDNPLRRALGLVAVQLHSAAPTVDVGWSVGSMASQRGAGQATTFEIPILRRADLDGFLHALMGGDWHVPPLTQRPAVARRRAVTRRVGLLLAVMAVPSLLFPPGSLVLLVVALIGVPWGLVAHRRAGYAETPAIVVLARGVLHHRIDLLPFSRVQSASFVQSPFQRAAKVCTLHVNVAGRAGDPNLFDMAEADARGGVRDLPRRSGPSGVGADVVANPAGTTG